MESESRDGLELTSCEILLGGDVERPGCISDRPPGLDKAAGQGGGFGDNRRFGPRELQRCSATAKASAMSALPGSAGLNAISTSALSSSSADKMMTSASS